MRGELREEELRWKTKTGDGRDEGMRPGEPWNREDFQLRFF